MTLATEAPGAPRLPPASLLEAAERDPSPLVRRSLASALPALPPADRWAVGAALAMHGEDATDRFLPKLLWSGLAPLVDEDLSRAAAITTEPPATAARLLEILDFSASRTRPPCRRPRAGRPRQRGLPKAPRGTRLGGFRLFSGIARHWPR